MDTRRRRTLTTSLLAALCVVVAGCDSSVDPSAEEVSAAETSAEETPSAEQEPAPPDAVDSPQVPPLLDAVDDLDETVVTISAAAGPQVRVDAKVAATADERRHGLMFVPDLPDGIGMLFVFDEDSSGGFWMRNTLVPLDIAYIDVDGVIGTVMTMEPCEAEEASDCPSYTPEQPYRYALEVPAGWLDEVGVTEGDVVTWTDPVPPR